MFKLKMVCCCFYLCCSILAVAQTGPSVDTKTEAEIMMLEKIFAQIAESDQKYRSPLAVGTLDKRIMGQIDSVGTHHGAAAQLAYQASLNLSLPDAVKDSLWVLQHQIDFQNHLILRGIFETYGYISKSEVEANNYVQHLVLLHPPKDWNVEVYLLSYTQLLKVEVLAGRMPARLFASFYDNMKAKILREPQLYGTNQQFDPKSKTILPPMIENLDKSNEARAAIGLPDLKEGEYRLFK